MQKTNKTLVDLPIGQIDIVQAVSGVRSVARRLMEMGILPGTSLEILRAAPLGDPLEIKVRDFLLSLRRSEAACIILGGSKSDGKLGVTPQILPQPPSVGTATTTRTRRVLVAGNPNSGKTTIFNALTGARARVSNYPGVTVTRLSRQVSLPDGAQVELIDLPGTYSLTARSLEEQVAADAVLGRHEPSPDAVIVVVDAGALERGLYLVLQILETGAPVIVALNMMDEVRAEVDVCALERWLGATVVPTVASQKTGVDKLITALEQTANHKRHDDALGNNFAAHTRGEIALVEQSVAKASFANSPAACRAWALLAILSADSETTGLPDSVKHTARQVRARAALLKRDIDLEIIGARYCWIEAVVSDVSKARGPAKREWTHKLDAVLTHRTYGFGIFAIVMAILFETLFTFSEPFISAIEQGTSWMQQLVTEFFPANLLRDLLVNGVLAGVGNVVVFVPQIALLFLFIALLEDVGYLARVAFVIDRVMEGIGLHGKAFVPMLSGFACAIPAVMATRTIEGKRDRLITMLTLPLMSCSARLPVYALVTAVIFSAEEKVFGFFSAGAVSLFAMYGLSVLATLSAAIVLKRTVLRGPRVPFLLELPPYRIPVLRSVFMVTWLGVRRFLAGAGTIILAMTIVLWALFSFPRSHEITNRYQTKRAQAALTGDLQKKSKHLAEIASQEASEQLSHSIGGRLGRAVEPIFEPLGFDWRIGVGMLGAFVAREVFVSTLGVVFAIQDADAEKTTLRNSLKSARKPDGSKLMTPLTGIALMVFFVLACQCMSTMVVIRQESGGWGWPLFMFGYMFALAYAAAFMVYQLGSALGLGVS